MKILTLDPKPIAAFPYSNVAAGGLKDESGNRIIEQVALEILHATTHHLPHSLDAIIISSDLQGHLRHDSQNTSLLGEKLPAFLSTLIQTKFPTLKPERILVLLCGDMFAHTNRRGGLGDVRNVWHQFKHYFGKVAGVAGNHDSFGSKIEFNHFKKTEDIYFLDGDVTEIAGIKIAGLSGVIGDPKFIFHRWNHDFQAELTRLLAQEPHILLLHEGPGDYSSPYPGNPEISALLSHNPATLVCCGHIHWKNPILQISHATQVLNTEARAVILTQHSELQQNS